MSPGDKLELIAGSIGLVVVTLVVTAFWWVGQYSPYPEKRPPWWMLPLWIIIALIVLAAAASAPEY
jgi:hypothetical protein